MNLITKVPALWHRHCELLDAANEAITQQDHDYFVAKLAGMREALDILNIKWAIASDLHTMEKYGDNTPMCCGELLDWKPKE